MKAKREPPPDRGRVTDEEMARVREILTESLRRQAVRDGVRPVAEVQPEPVAEVTKPQPKPEA